MRKSIIQLAFIWTAWLPLVIGCSEQSEPQPESAPPPASATIPSSPAPQSNPPFDPTPLDTPSSATAVPSAETAPVAKFPRLALDPLPYRSGWSAIAPSAEIPEYPVNQGKKTWFAVSLQDNVASFERVTQRPSTWIWTVDRYGGTTDTTPEAEPPAKIERQSVAMPAAAHFAVRETNGFDTPLGKRRSLLSAPVMLQPELKSAFEIGDEKWTLITDYVKDGDGQPLQGSLILIAVRADGARLLLVPPASGAAFEKQELLWLAREPSATTFDYILKRTYITGGFVYDYAFNGGIGSVGVDPDRPYERMISGEEPMYSWVHTGHHPLQTRELPPEPNGPEFSIDEEEWNAALTVARGSTQRRVLFERDLKVKSGTIHFIVEYLPLYPGNDDEPGSETAVTGENLFVKVTFRGRTQTLLQIGEMHSYFNAKVDEQDGQPVIELYVSTEYNYFTTYQWVWSKEEDRFLKLLIYYQSGC